MSTKLPNPYDGFRAEIFESKLNNRYELYVVVFSQGRRISQCLIHTSPIDRLAEIEARFYVLQSMCRLMNTGEDPLVILRMAEGVQAFCEDRMPDGLESPWQLTAVRYHVDEPIAIFTNTKTGKCVVIEEDSRVDEYTPEELIRESLDYNGPKVTTDTKTPNRQDSKDQDEHTGQSGVP